MHFVNPIEKRIFFVEFEQLLVVRVHDVFLFAKLLGSWRKPSRCNEDDEAVMLVRDIYYFPIKHGEVIFLDVVGLPFFTLHDQESF